MEVDPTPEAILVFDNPDFVDTAGIGSESESDNVQAFLSSNGLDFDATEELTADGLSAALAGKDVFIVPELEVNPGLADTLDEAAETAIADWVAAGGRLLVFYPWGIDQFLNQTFGFSVSESYQDGEYTKSAATAGSSLSDNADTLPYNDATGGLVNLPTGSEIYYQGASGEAAVAAIPFGDGEVLFYGWDYYDAAPAGIQDSGWNDVLNDLITQTTDFV